MIQLRFSKFCGATILSGCMLVSTSAATAAVQNSGMPADDAVTIGTPTYQPSVQDVANPQILRVEQNNSSDALIDPRAKAAWLTECRRRAGINGVAAPLKHAKDATGVVADTPSYDYCEAYLDDYYRNYAQSASANSYVYQSQALPQPAQLARAASNEQMQPYEEIITEEYVPVRTRSVARRAAPKRLNDKRVRLYPR